MAKISKIPVEAEYKHSLHNQMLRAFTLMESKAEISYLIRDLFTRTEIEMFLKRLEIARMLIYGEDYKSIKKQLHVTDSTIAKVQNQLHGFGAGFTLAVERLDKTKRKPKRNYLSPKQAVVAREVWKGLGRMAVRQVKRKRKKWSAKK